MPRDDEARRALEELLLRGDLSGVPVDQLVIAGKYARRHRNELREFAGKVAAQLNHDGMTWAQIGEALDMQPMTAYRWAQPYM